MQPPMEDGSTKVATQPNHLVEVCRAFGSVGKSLLLIMGSHESNWETKADADILRRMAAYLQLSVDQILVISGAKDQRKEFRDPFGKTN